MDLYVDVSAKLPDNDRFSFSLFGFANIFEHFVFYFLREIKTVSDFRSKVVFSF